MQEKDCSYYFPLLLLFYFRLDIKSVGKDYVDFLKDSIKNVLKIEIWHHNQSQAWVEAEWELNKNADNAGIVRLSPLIKTGYKFDIRVIAIGLEDKINVLSENNIRLKGLFYIIYFCFIVNPV